MHYFRRSILSTPRLDMRIPPRFPCCQSVDNSIQKFTADLMGSNNVAPFKAPKNTAGEATISVEAAGTVVCFDASFFKASKTFIGCSVVLAGGSGFIWVPRVKLAISSWT
jgi:hypothetical protein